MVIRIVKTFVRGLSTFSQQGGFSNLMEPQYKCYKKLSWKVLTVWIGRQSPHTQFYRLYTQEKRSNLIIIIKSKLFQICLGDKKGEQYR